MLIADGVEQQSTIPPYNLKATTAADVYKLNDSILLDVFLPSSKIEFLKNTFWILYKIVAFAFSVFSPFFKVQISLSTVWVNPLTHKIWL